MHTEPSISEARTNSNQALVTEDVGRSSGEDAQSVSSPKVSDMKIIDWKPSVFDIPNSHFLRPGEKARDPLSDQDYTEINAMLDAMDKTRDISANGREHGNVSR